MTLPVNLTEEKNKIASPNPFIVLIDFIIPAPVSQTFYLACNNEDIIFQGHTYTALPIEIDATKQSMKGTIPSVTLKLCNVTRFMRYYIELADGAIGSEIKLYVVNTEYLTEDYSELELDFIVTGSSFDAYWIYLTLGPPNPLRRRFPLHRYLADRCRYVSYFKGAECKYAGADTTCLGRLKDCQDKNNSENFGGFPGCGSASVRIA